MDSVAHTIHLFFMALFGYASSYKVFDILRAPHTTSRPARLITVYLRVCVCVCVRVCVYVCEG